MDGDTPRTTIRALRTLDVDGVRVEEGAVAAIRSVLVAELVRAGACDDEMEGAAAAPSEAGPPQQATGETPGGVSPAAAAAAPAPKAKKAKGP